MVLLRLPSQFSENVTVRSRSLPYESSPVYCARSKPQC